MSAKWHHQDDLLSTAQLEHARQGARRWSEFWQDEQLPRLAALHQKNYREYTLALRRRQLVWLITTLFAVAALWLLAAGLAHP